jgi:hypothetical protein
VGLYKCEVTSGFSACCNPEKRGEAMSEVSGDVETVQQMRDHFGLARVARSRLAPYYECIEDVLALGYSFSDVHRFLNGRAGVSVGYVTIWEYVMRRRHRHRQQLRGTKVPWDGKFVEPVTSAVTDARVPSRRRTGMALTPVSSAAPNAMADVSDAPSGSNAASEIAAMIKPGGTSDPVELDRIINASRKKFFEELGKPKTLRRNRGASP